MAAPLRSPSSSSKIHGLPSDPRAIMTAATPVASNASRVACALCRPPLRITGASSVRTSSAASA
jgi:hypothetical protein